MKKISKFFSKIKKNKKKELSPEIAAENNKQTAVAAYENKKSKADDSQSSDSASVYTYVHGFDRPMFIIIVLLSLFGLIMVYSSSYVHALTYIGNSAHFAIRQAIFLAIGMGLMIFISMFGYKIIKVFTPLLFAATLLMLVLVLVVGVSEGDAKRWIYFGPISVQPSEVMKIALILMIALIADKYKVTINSKKKFWRASLYGTLFPLILTGVACVLVLLENHLSGTIILFLIGFSLIWANGSPKIWSIALFATIIAAVVFVIVMVDNYPEQVKKLVPDYMFVRVDSWLNPENYDARDELWQTLQGQIAIGSGGFFGRGFGQSLQKHLFVSMPQNDFIFTIICEELGFIGAAVVIALYVAFVVRGFYIAKNTPDVFCSVTAVGISAHVGLQALLNIGVVTGVLPNTGISLPFFSAGGSSLVILFFEMGLLLAISKYTPVYEKTPKKRRRWFFWRKEN